MPTGCSSRPHHTSHGYPGFMVQGCPALLNHIAVGTPLPPRAPFTTAPRTPLLHCTGVITLRAAPDSPSASPGELGQRQGQGQEAAAGGERGGRAENVATLAVRTMQKGSSYVIPWALMTYHLTGSLWAAVGQPMLDKYL